MKQKPENLVAGRLDPGPPKTEEVKDSPAQAEPGYGYERLGISCDATEVAGAPTPPEPSSRPYLAQPQDQSRAEAPYEAWQQGTADPWLSRPDIRPERAAPLLQHQGPQAIRQSIDWLSRYKSKAIMAAGGIAVAGILAIVLAAWSKATSSPMSPQTASAKPQALPEQADVGVSASRQQAIGEPAAGGPRAAKQPKLKVWEVLSPRDHEPGDLPGPVTNPTGSVKVTAPDTAGQHGPQSPAPKPQPPKAPRIRYRSCPPGFVLNGIVKAPAGLVANVNGKFVSAGSIVNGAKVVEVQAYSVEMELGGERFLLGMGGRTSTPSSPRSQEGDETSSEDGDEPQD